MRTSRISTTVLATATAALALTLTACGGSAGASTQSNGEKGSERAAAAGSDAAAKASGTSTGRDATGKDASGQGAGPGGSADVRQCGGDELSYSVLHRFPKQQGEHLLITARNAAAKPCWVTSFPSVMLGDTSNVLPHSAKDAPGGRARITVKPGGKVYSAVSLFADGSSRHTSTSLSLALRDQTGDTGPGTEQEAVDGKGAPSKFTWTSADVTYWNTSKPYDF